MPHSLQDRVSLEIARRVASELSRRSDWIALARGNLDRWSDLNRGSPALLRSYEEWRTILARPVAEVCAVLIADTEEGQRLRQNSPFAGALSPDQVWDIKRSARHEQNAA